MNHRKRRELARSVSSIRSRNRQIKSLQFERFETRICLSGIGFASHDLVRNELAGVNWVRGGDLDGDGDTDLIVTSFLDNKISWFENTPNGFARPVAISTTADGPRSAIATDLDGDGDLDIVSASSWDDTVAWYENTNGQAAFGPKRVVSANEPRVEQVFAADLDADGDMDLISASSESASPLGRVVWHENTDGLGTFGAPEPVGRGARFVRAADMDGDGDLDVITSSYNRTQWYENLDGHGTFSSDTVISVIRGTREIFTADIDGDGDIDVLSGGSTGLTSSVIAWHENTGNGSRFIHRNILINSQQGVTSVFLADVDVDGDLDVLATSFRNNQVAWYENDGTQRFQFRRISNEAVRARSVYAGDLDGDGDLDVVSASPGDNKIAWYEQLDGRGSFGQPIILTRPGVVGARAAVPADVDGDGDIDVVSASYPSKQIAWHENESGQGNFPEQHAITTADNLLLVDDMDGDGAVDVIVAVDDSVAWLKNLDGQGTFGPLLPFPEGTRHGVVVRDINGDGDNDIVTVSTNGFTWFEKTESEDLFISPHDVTVETGELMLSMLGAADYDGDGDIDLLFQENDFYGITSRLSWFENTDGNGGFSVANSIPANGIVFDTIRSVDLDGDGDNDLLGLVSSLNMWSSPDGIHWLENRDGKGTFPAPRAIDIERPSIFADAADMDGDGDLDIVSGSSYFIGETVWYEYLGRPGEFASPVRISDETRLPIAIADLDGDGDTDVLGDQIVGLFWFANRPIGDANNDGVFDSEDFVKVFQAGEYEDHIDGNSTYDEGDWNGDGDFDSSDLVLAFQAGTFVRQALTSSVAAAVDLHFSQDGNNRDQK